MKRITSRAFFLPSFDQSIPEGCAVARRTWDNGRPMCDEWPAVAIGESIEIETDMHWLWSATLVAVIDNNRWVIRPIGEKQPLPLPEPVEGKPYVLPYMSGDAWSERPEKGKILAIAGQFYRAKTKPKYLGAGAGYAYTLERVPQEVYARRTGRVALKDRALAGHVGRAIQIGEEWLHIERTEKQAYGDGEGREVFGHILFGAGHYVPADKAEKLNRIWRAAERVASIELSLKVARQDIDYGGNPEAIPGLEADLEAAKTALVKLGGPA